MNITAMRQRNREPRERGQVISVILDELEKLDKRTQEYIPELDRRVTALENVFGVPPAPTINIIDSSAELRAASKPELTLIERACRVIHPGHDPVFWNSQACADHLTDADMLSWLEGQPGELFLPWRDDDGTWRNDTPARPLALFPTLREALVHLVAEKGEAK